MPLNIGLHSRQWQTLPRAWARHGAGQSLRPLPPALALQAPHTLLPPLHNEMGRETQHSAEAGEAKQAHLHHPNARRLRPVSERPPCQVTIITRALALRGSPLRASWCKAKREETGPRRPNMAGPNGTRPQGLGVLQQYHTVVPPPCTSKFIPTRTWIGSPGEAAPRGHACCMHANVGVMACAL